MQRLPFGWSYSPLLCQKIFEEIAFAIVPSHMFVYVYIDDFLLVGQDKEEVERVTGRLTVALREKGFLVSPKSTLSPVQSLNFLGKLLNFGARTIRATNFSCAQLIFRWLRMATGTTGRKFLRSFFGLLIWLSRPHRGIAAFHGGAGTHICSGEG
jgi:hypothetical protein